MKSEQWVEVARVCRLCREASLHRFLRRPGLHYKWRCKTTGCRGMITVHKRMGKNPKRTYDELWDLIETRKKILAKAQQDLESFIRRRSQIQAKVAKDPRKQLRGPDAIRA